jgi:hypothetical protein
VDVLTILVILIQFLMDYVVKILAIYSTQREANLVIDKRMLNICEQLRVFESLALKNHHISLV